MSEEKQGKNTAKLCVVNTLINGKPTGQKESK